MSIHPSLAISDKDKKQRSVLKRSERIKIMLEKGDWKEGDAVFALPKLKTVRVKLKKEKVEKPEETAAAEAGAALATGETKPAKEAGAKTTAGAKTETLTKPGLKQSEAKK